MTTFIPIGILHCALCGEDEMWFAPSAQDERQSRIEFARAHLTIGRAMCIDCHQAVSDGRPWAMRRAREIARGAST